MTTSAILEKLQKLKELAARPGTPAEAAVATAKMQEILFRYNLSMADVDGHVQDSAYIDEDLVVEATRHTQWKLVWQKSLVHAIARHNFCKSVWWSGTYRLSVLGLRHNVDAVLWMHRHVAGEISRLAVEARSLAAVPPGSRTSWTRSFCLGAVREIANRLFEQRERDTAASAQSTALVHVSVEALKKAVAERFGKLNASRPSREASHYDAYRSGCAAAKRISLSRPLGTSGARKEIR